MVIGDGGYNVDTDTIIILNEFDTSEVENFKHCILSCQKYSIDAWSFQVPVKYFLPWSF